MLGIQSKFDIAEFKENSEVCIIYLEENTQATSLKINPNIFLSSSQLVASSQA